MNEQNYNQQDNNNYQQNDNNYQGYSNDPYQNPYQQGSNEPPKQTNVLAIVGMILGIISIVAGCCGWYSLFLAVPGLICSIMSRKQGKSGMSVAGIVCSIIGLIIGVLMTAVAIGVVALMSGTPEFQDILKFYGY